MIPLESPVPESGPPGSESGGRKRTQGLRTAARLRKRRMSHLSPTGYAPPLDSTRMLSVPYPQRVPVIRRPPRLLVTLGILELSGGSAHAEFPPGHYAALPVAIGVDVIAGPSAAR